MTRKLTTVALWFSADPNRFRVATLIIAAAIAVAGVFIPGLSAFADGVPGGSGKP
jgi:hypothetical protein